MLFRLSSNMTSLICTTTIFFFFFRNKTTYALRISDWSSAVCSSDLVSGKSVIVLLSGGLDSMVCAGLAREAGARIVALTIDYNQRHRVELESAARIADFVVAAEHIVLPLDMRRFGGSALTADIAVPKDEIGSAHV